MKLIVWSDIIVKYIIIIVKNKYRSLKSTLTLITLSSYLIIFSLLWMSMILVFLNNSHLETCKKNKIEYKVGESFSWKLYMQGRKWRWICYSMLTRISSHRKRRERKQQSKGYINDIKCFCTKYRCAKIYVERCFKLIYSFVRLFLFRINRRNQRLKFNHKFVTSVSIFLVHFNCIV